MDFNPHPHEEGDAKTDTVGITLLNFNPHPHEEGDRPLCSCCVLPRYFNPHPHEEGDFCKGLFTPREIISIHTLTKRVTVVRTSPYILDLISIHTLTKRVTQASGNDIAACGYFNPHSHEEGDSDCGQALDWSGEISIHTLTKRVTAQNVSLLRSTIFQSTPSRRG